MLAGISKTILIKLNGHTAFYTGNLFGGKRESYESKLIIW